MIKYVTWFVPTVLATAALITLVIRIGLPYVDLYQDELVAQIQNMTDAEVQVGEVNIQLRGYQPIIQLSDVAVTYAEREENLQLASLRVEFNLWESLWLGRLLVSGIYAQNGALTLVREADGAVSGVVPLSDGDGQADLRVQMRNVTITWKDLSLQQDYVFAATDLSLNSEQNRRRVIFRSLLPENLGEHLFVAADFTGALNDPASWQGSFHVDARRINVKSSGELFALDKDYDGALTLDLRGELNQGKVLWARGRVECQQCRMPTADEIDFETVFAWDNEPDVQQFALSDFSLKTPAIAFAEVTLLGKKQTADDELIWALRVPKIDTEFLDLMNTYTQFEDTDISLSAESGSLFLVASSPAPKLPEPLVWYEVRQVFAEHDWGTVNSARLVMDLEDGVMRVPSYILKPVHYDAIALSASFTRAESDWVLILDDVSLQTDVADFRGQASWFDIGSAPQISGAIELTGLPLNELSEWVPTDKLNPKFADWLSKAFVSGVVERARLELGGEMNAFPFVQGDGRFLITANVRDMEMNYRSQRERLEQVDATMVLNKSKFTAAASKLKYYDLYTDDVLVTIDDITLPYIEVRGSLHGPLADVFDYVKQAQLVDADSLIIRNVQFGGDSELEVSVGAALSQRVEKPVRAEGLLRFKQSDFAIPALDIKLEELTGDLHFDPRGGNAEQLELVWDGRRLTGGAQAMDGSTLLSFRGNLATGDLASRLVSEASKLMTGESNWQIDVKLPDLDPRTESKDALTIKLASDLAGTELLLPAPFEKNAIDERSFAMDLTVDEEGNDYQFEYADIVAGHLRKGSSSLMDSGHIHFGMSSEMPKIDVVQKGLVVSGIIEQTISLDEWVEFDFGSDEDAGTYVNQADLVFSDLWLGGVALGKFGFKAQQGSAENWDISLDSTDISGDVRLTGTPENRQVRAEMERLIFRETGMLEIFNPDGDIKPLLKSEILADEFRYGDVHGKDFILLLSPLEAGTRVDRLRMNAGEVTVLAEGQWRTLNTGVRSIFEVSAEGEDYGAFFEAWGLAQDFEGGNGRLHGRLSWPGSPADFGFDELRGELNLDLKDGFVKQIEPGIGRLLGLMNVGTVVRRLSLDFQDVFKKGLSFDELTADFEFEGGAMHTDNFSLTGPSMGLLLRGRTGILDQNYNQQVEVIPNLSSSLPLAGALVGGPLAGMSVYLIDKLTNIGDQIDKAVVLKYQVTGSWDDPQVEFVESVVTSPIQKGPLKPLFDRLIPKQFRDR